MIEITDINDVRIQCFRSLRDSSLSNQDKIIAESEKVVLKLLNGTDCIDILFANPEFITSLDQELLNRCENVYTAKRKLMEQIVGHTLHHGVMALAKRPSNKTLDELPLPCVVLNGLASAENVGAIMRNCAAFGVKSLLVDSRSCSPYIRRAIRVSMGNVFKLAIRTTDNLPLDLKSLQDRGVPVIATANVHGAIDIDSYMKKSEDYALIIGNEGYGIDQDILDQSTSVLRIPIDDETAAINAACASAVFLYKLQSS